MNLFLQTLQLSTLLSSPVFFSISFCFYFINIFFYCSFTIIFSFYFFADFSFSYFFVFILLICFLLHLIVFISPQHFISSKLFLFSFYLLCLLLIFLRVLNFPWCDLMMFYVLWVVFCWQKSIYILNCRLLHGW